MSMLKDLSKLGVDVDGVIVNLGGKDSLYEKLLFKFYDMIEKETIDYEFDINDYEDVLHTVHTIKGTAGNLGITPIYESYTKVLDLLRSDKPKKAKKILKKSRTVQGKIMKCIKKYM